MAEIGIEPNESAAGAATRRLAAIRGAINPTTLVALLLVTILIFLVANPLFQLVKQSFTKASDHSFTFANYVTAFGRPRYVHALINSLELGAVAPDEHGLWRELAENLALREPRNLQELDGLLDDRLQVHGRHEVDGAARVHLDLLAEVGRPPSRRLDLGQ